PANTERPDEGNLQEPDDDLMGTGAKKTGETLDRVKDGQKEPEGDQEGHREEPVDKPGTG
ncbi:MAG: hypothetical protein H6Q51_2039, partial [Deltaproteobacteria bacterium]|nr:hypothetical protein [Deltaproteobacteria bacterium]